MATLIDDPYRTSSVDDPAHSDEHGAAAGDSSKKPHEPAPKHAQANQSSGHADGSLHQSDAAPPTPHDQPKRPFYTRPVLMAVTIIVLAIAVTAGIFYTLHALTYESTDDAFITANVVQVSPRVSGRVSRVLVDDNQRVSKGDKLVELDPTDFQAKVDEATAALNAAIAREKAAAVQVQLMTVTSSATSLGAQSAVVQAESDVATAKATVLVAKSKIASANADIAADQAAAAQARADALAAGAEVTRTTTELNRLSGLAANVVSQQELINARAAADVADAKRIAAGMAVTAAEARITQGEAELKTAKQAVDEAVSRQKASEAMLEQARAQFTGADVSRQKIAVSKSEYADAQAEVARMQAQLDQAKLALSYTTIVAPTDGRVTHKNVEVGQHLDLGQAVMAIVPPRMWVTANFKETQLDEIRPGQVVNIDIDAYPGLKLKGHVDSIQRGSGAAFSLMPPENATGNYVKVVQRVPVKILIDNMPDTNHPIGPGMSVSPEVKVR